MVNMYDQPAQAEFINSYVPVPFQDILQAGTNKQQNYDVHKAAYERMAEEAQNLRAIPTSQDEEYIKGTVIPTMQELSDKYATQDYGDPEVIREINRTLREKINRRLVGQIQESYTNWQENQKNVGKLKMAGQYQDYIDEPYKGYSTANAGIYTYQTPAALDYRKPAEEYFNQIKPSTLTGINPATGEYYVGVDMNKVTSVAKENIGSYLQSPAGQQKIQEYRHRTGDMNTPAEKIAYDYLLDVGESFTYKNRDFAPEYYMRALQGPTPTLDINDASNTQAILNKNLISPDIVKQDFGFNPTKIKSVGDILSELKLDDQGNIIKKDASKESYTGLSTKFLKDIRDDKIPGLTFKKGVFDDKIIDTKTGKTLSDSEYQDKVISYKKEQQQNKYDEEYTKTKSKIDKLRELNPSFNDLADAEVLYNYATAYNNTSSSDFNKYLYSNDELAKSKRDLITSKVQPDLGSRDILIAETGKKLKSGEHVNNLEALYDVFGVKDDKKGEAYKSFQITGIVPALGGYSASIVVDGQPKEFIVSPNQRDQAVVSLVEEASKKNLQGIVGARPMVVNGKEYVITTRVSSSGSFESNVKTKDGSEIIPGKKSLPLNELEAYTASLLQYK